MKNYHHLERLVRGFSNHRRIEILDLLSRKPELSVSEICQELEVNFKTIAEHIRRLAMAGLVLKRSDDNNVRHKLTDTGKAILVFLRTLVWRNYAPHPKWTGRSGDYWDNLLPILPPFNLSEPNFFNTSDSKL